MTTVEALRPPRRATSAPTSRVAPGPNLIADVSIELGARFVGSGVSVQASDSPVIPSSRHAPEQSSLSSHVSLPRAAVVAAVDNHGRPIGRQ